jgi:hypothetical protein
MCIEYQGLEIHISYALWCELLATLPYNAGKGFYEGDHSVQICHLL